MTVSAAGAGLPAPATDSYRFLPVTLKQCPWYVIILAELLSERRGDIAVQR
jgi:hypothetical protein